MLCQQFIFLSSCQGLHGGNKSSWFEIGVVGFGEGVERGGVKLEAGFVNVVSFLLSGLFVTSVKGLPNWPEVDVKLEAGFVEAMLQFWLFTGWSVKELTNWPLQVGVVKELTGGKHCNPCNFSSISSKQWPIVVCCFRITTTLSFMAIWKE